MGSVQIRSGQIQDSAILTAKIADDAISSAKIADDAVLAAALSTGCVTADAMATNAIVAAALSADCVTADKLATNSVTADAIANGSVDTAAIQAQAINSGLLGAGAVTSAKIAANAVQTAAVGDLQITKQKLSAASVDSTKMDMTATYDFSSGVVRVVTTPAHNNDATSKQYVDSVAQGSHWKDNVKCSPNSNIDVSSLPATIDGQTLQTDDRFLLKSQTAAAQNGVYLYKGSGNAAVRSSDMDAGSEFPGAAVLVLAGSNIHKSYVCTNATDPTLGTTAITWTQFAGSGADGVTASGGLTRVGNDISIANLGVSTAKIADGAITSQKLGSNSVNSAAIGSAQVTQAKLANSSVGTPQIIAGSVNNSLLANLSVSTAKLQDSCISTQKLADASLTSQKFATGSVNTAALGDDQVTAAKLAPNSVESAAISAGSINNAAMFGAGAVNNAALANASVSSAKIVAGAVGTSALADVSVSTQKLANSSVTKEKLGITFKQEIFQIGNNSTTTIDLAQALAANSINGLLAWKNGVQLKNMTAFGDTGNDNDEFNVNGTGGASGVARLTFGAALSSGDAISVWCWF